MEPIVKKVNDSMITFRRTPEATLEVENENGAKTVITDEYVNSLRVIVIKTDDDEFKEILRNVLEAGKELNVTFKSNN